MQSPLPVLNNLVVQQQLLLMQLPLALFCRYYCFFSTITILFTVVIAASPPEQEVADFFGFCGHQLHRLVSFPKELSSEELPGHLVVLFHLRPEFARSLEIAEDVVSLIGRRLQTLSEPSADLASHQH